MGLDAGRFAIMDFRWILFSQWSMKWSYQLKFGPRGRSFGDLGKDVGMKCLGEERYEFVRETW